MTINALEVLEKVLGLQNEELIQPPLDEGASTRPLEV